jgi:hypothetical protein
MTDQVFSDCQMNPICQTDCDCFRLDLDTAVIKVSTNLKSVKDWCGILETTWDPVTPLLCFWPGGT